MTTAGVLKIKEQLSLQLSGTSVRKYLANFLYDDDTCALYHKSTKIGDDQRIVLSKEDMIAGINANHKSGRKGTVTLQNILKFVTWADEEPVLGYAIKPSIDLAFPATSYFQTSNTCIYKLNFFISENGDDMPTTEILFRLIDYSFSNNYFEKGRHTNIPREQRLCLKKETIPKQLGLEDFHTIEKTPDRPNIFIKKIKKEQGTDVMNEYEQIVHKLCDDLYHKKADFPVTLLFLPVYYMSEAMVYLLSLFDTSTINDSIYSAICSGQDQYVIDATIAELKKENPTTAGININFRNGV
ncbi:unnamed protein product [Mytilus edulis]|uniref:Uncharacterized protein n=1 Tax=Mytilus edulis TaxID=6550 RepID=A0A8S3PU10_MYTED|nr:unnamed protein product [Mytilus edulis]